MSIKRINRYYKEVFEAQSFSGAVKETSLKRYFANLLADYLEMYFPKTNRKLIDEVKLPNLRKQPDGAVIDSINFVFGYWEAKDDADDLEKELQGKINIGYPTENLLIQNQQKGILVRGETWETFDMQNAKVLDQILRKYLAFEPETFLSFRLALEKFTQDVPHISKVLKQMIVSRVENGVSRVEGGVSRVENGGSRVEGGGSRVENTQSSNLNTQPSNPEFIQKRQEFLDLCKVSINPKIDFDSIDEMIIQHILTEEIFKTVFNDTQFHEENNIAKILTALEKTFFVGQTKRQTLASIQPYYEAIKAHSVALHTHEQKQDFLKIVYENFYQAYNPKSADKLGIVYTPSEIVQFMIESVDYLLEQNFDRNLGNKGIEILDPATGTGTFITDLLKYLPPQNLLYKYKNEIHANEIGILPYYIANLNIEYIYNQRMKNYETFDNLCWVDTLDNLGGMEQGWRGKESGYEVTGDLFAISAENAKRIKTQNERKISVIMGNPPYNANQQNENDNNKNREYPQIDARIKKTFIKESAAQKTKLYDMYVRFYRWAMDRINNEGIIAFVTNRSFIDSRTFDGFRKIVGKEFSQIYVLDLQGDVRKNDSKQGGNVFDIMTGVAIAFFVKKEEDNAQYFEMFGKLPTAKIYYHNIGDFLKTSEKIQILRERKFQQLDFERIRPDAKHNWISQSESNFEELILLIDKNLESKQDIKSIFEFSGIGVNTARDEWVFDFDSKNLEKKIKFFINFYNDFLQKYTVPDADKIWKLYLKKHADKNGKGKNGNGKPQLVNMPEDWGTVIKWSRDLKAKFLRNDFSKNKLLKFNKKKIVRVAYRPFVQQFYYADKTLSDVLTQHHYRNFGLDLQSENALICTSVGERLPFSAFLVKMLPTFQFYVDPATCFPLYRYENGEKVENITDWALALFLEKYESVEGGVSRVEDTTLETPSSILETRISKTDIFHYVYAVLHKPEYRKTYEIDLKRDFPRIPLYPDFWKYAEAGRELMELHLGYEDRGLSVEGRDSSVENSTLAKQTNINTEENDLQGLTSLAGSHEFGNGSLQGNTIISPRGEIRIDESSKESIGVSTIEHSGGTPTEQYGAISTIPVDSERIVGGGGNAIIDSGTSKLFELNTNEKLANADRQDGKSVGRLDQSSPKKDDIVASMENRGLSVGETILETQYSTLETRSSILNPLKVIRKPLESLLPKQKTEDLAQKAEILSKIVPQVRLKVNKEKEIEIDEITSISGIPAEVWEYKLGNRSAVEWVLDQYKPYQSGDATIQEQFNNYDFADYKEELIDLLLKVIFVSTETMRIVKRL